MNEHTNAWVKMLLAKEEQDGVVKGKGWVRWGANGHHSESQWFVA